MGTRYLGLGARYLSYASLLGGPIALRRLLGTNYLVDLPGRYVRRSYGKFGGAKGYLLHGNYQVNVNST